MLMLSERTVRRLVKEKKLQAASRRGAWKIPHEAIVDFYLKVCYW